MFRSALSSVIRTWALEGVDPPARAFEVRGEYHPDESDASRHFTFRTVTSSAGSPNVSTRPGNHAQFAALVLQGFSQKLVSPREAAALLCVNRETIYRLCARGELAHVRVGSALRVDLVEYLATQRSRADIDMPSVERCRVDVTR
jgi:excisionase family DNA binding protein